MLAALIATALIAPTDLVIYQSDQERSKIIQIQSNGKQRTISEFKAVHHGNEAWLQIALSQDRKRVAWFEYWTRPIRGTDALRVFVATLGKDRVATWSFPLENSFQVTAGFDVDNKVTALRMDSGGSWTSVNSNRAKGLNGEPSESYAAAPHWCGVIWLKDEDRLLASDTQLGVQVEERSGRTYVRWFNRKEVPLSLPRGRLLSIAPGHYPYVYAAIDESQDPRGFLGRGKCYVYQLDVRNGISLRLAEGASVVVATAGAPFSKP